jgi:hypothetical protein
MLLCNLLGAKMVGRLFDSFGKDRLNVWRISPEFRLAATREPQDLSLLSTAQQRPRSVVASCSCAWVSCLRKRGRHKVESTLQSPVGCGPKLTAE